MNCLLNVRRSNEANTCALSNSQKGSMKKLHSSPSSSAFATAFNNRKDQNSICLNENTNKIEFEATIRKFKTYRPEDELKWDFGKLRDKDEIELPSLPRSTTDSAISQNRQVLYDSYMTPIVDDRKVSTPNLEERNFRNVDNGFDAKDACNARSFEAVGMEKLIPSLRRRQHFDESDICTENIKASDGSNDDKFGHQRNNNRNKPPTTEVCRHVVNNNTMLVKSADETKECFTTKSSSAKRKNKMKSTFNSVFRSLRSRADKLLTNFLSSGNYNRLIIATSAATAAVKRTSDTEEEDEEGKFNTSSSSFHCGPQLTVSLGCNNNKNKAGYNRLEADDFDSDGEFSRKVRRSRTLDFKYANSTNVPVRSNSTAMVTQATSSNNPFEDSFVNGDSENKSNQEGSMSSSQPKHDNSTQVPLKDIISRPSSPTNSFIVTPPDITRLVSPRASICSTPGMTSSEWGQEGEDESSDESWDDEDLTCNVCDRAFVTPWHLERHQQKKRHWGCNVCDTLFQTSMSLEYHKEEYGHWTSDEDDDCDEDEEVEIEDCEWEEEKPKIDDHNNNKNKQSKCIEDVTNTCSGLYINSKSDNSKSCFQLKDMSNEIDKNYSSSNQRMPKTQSMAFDFEWDDNEERKIRNRPCGGEKVLLL